MTFIVSHRSHRLNTQMHTDHFSAIREFINENLCEIFICNLKYNAILAVII